MADLDRLLAALGPLSALDRIAADARRAYRQIAPHLPAMQDGITRAADMVSAARVRADMTSARRTLPLPSPPQYHIPTHLDRLIITPKERQDRE